MGCTEGEWLRLCSLGFSSAMMCFTTVCINQNALLVASLQEVNDRVMLWLLLAPALPRCEQLQTAAAAPLLS